MKKLFLLLACVVPYCVSYAQNSQLQDSLERELSKAEKAADRIELMADLSRVYLGIDNEKSEGYASQMMELADSARDRELMILAYLRNADRCLNFSAQKQYLSRGIEYSNKALEIARSNNFSDYEAWAYSYLARGWRTNGEVDKAVNYNNLAISLASNSNNDLLRVSVYNSLGNTYMQKDEKLPPASLAGKEGDPLSYHAENAESKG